MESLEAIKNKYYTMFEAVVGRSPTSEEKKLWDEIIDWESTEKENDADVQ